MVLFAIVLILLTGVAVGAQAGNGVRVSYLYNLSNFSGTVPYSDVKLSVDRQHDEIYAIFQNNVSVFNGSGMEVYRFGDRLEYGHLRDLATDENGDLYLLTYDLSLPAEDNRDPRYFIVRCNYRGDPEEKIPVTDSPPRYSRLNPHILFYRDGRFLLVDRIGMLAVWVDRNGKFLKGLDFNELLEIPEKDRPGTEIFGFDLDRAGNMLLTVPVLFCAFVISPDGGSVSSFGKAGSGPGKFGIVTGVVSDDHGNYLVSDTLRNVVMVFDRNFQFLTEFGYFGGKPGNLVRPATLAYGNSGKLFVTQSRKRGVSVFSVTSNGSSRQGEPPLRKGGGEAAD